MSKCLCYKCDCATIRRYRRKSRRDDQIFFGLHIYCGRTNTDIINEEVTNEEFFFTEYFFQMTCNRFKEAPKPIPCKGEIRGKIVKETEEAARKQKLKDS